MMIQNHQSVAADEQQSSPASTASCLLYFESSIVHDSSDFCDRVLQACPPNAVQSVHLLYGNKRALVVCHEPCHAPQVEAAFLATFTTFKRSSIPYFSTTTTAPLVLTCELNDTQLSRVSSDLSTALERIQTQTGLRAVAPANKTFTGYLFQFLILHELLQQQEAPTTALQNLTVSPPTRTWEQLFEQSQVKCHLQVKPNDSAHCYDVYVFQADLTDLNVDVLVNAGVDGRLHPASYIGDGIARRVRDKGGKAMQDACKRLLRQERGGVDKLDDGEVVATRGGAKLRCKYVLHAVAPKWSAYVLDERATQRTVDRFEPLLEQTFVNILREAHRQPESVTSMGVPVSANSEEGGAFDVPVELVAHCFYMKLIEFKLDDETTANKVSTICVTSLEEDTTRKLCELLTMYNESYKTSSWALPLSPFSRLVSETRQTPLAPESPSPPPPPPSSQTPPVFESPRERTFSFNKNEQQPQQQYYSKSSSGGSSRQQQQRFEQQNPPRNIQILQRDKTTSLSSKPRTISNSSHSSSPDNANQLRQQQQQQKKQPIVECCLFCQKESSNERDFVGCGNGQCKAHFCQPCLVSFMQRQKSNKCPSCHLNVVDYSGGGGGSFRKPGPSSSGIKPLMSSDVQAPFSSGASSSSSGHHGPHKHAITEGQIKIRILDTPCEGYEKFNSLMITFQIEDGTQGENHPKPGMHYKGTTKVVYLPEIPEHKEILAFYNKALRMGILFKVAVNKNTNEYCVQLNKEVLLKTSMTGGGPFGYPDSTYISKILAQARSYK